MSEGRPSEFPPPKRESNRINLLTAVLMILVAAMLWRVWGDNARRRELLDPDAKPRTVDARGDLAEDEKVTIQLFKNVSPSVVNVTTASTVRSGIFKGEEEVPRGTGTGFVWDRDGRIVTNAHVLLDATSARVTLRSKVYNAEVVGYDVDHDLAVLKIDAPPELLTPIALGTSHDLQVGQKVFAIGNPFGLDKTLSTGVVSGLEREFNSLTNRPITGAIQIDAAINPGNSGGPLLDSAGRLIGINTAIAGKTGQSAGVGFAIPVDMVNRIVPQLIKYGRTQRVGLGISIAQDRVVQYLIQQKMLPRRGVLVWQNADTVPAIQSGLKGTVVDEKGEHLVELGDLIIGLDKADVETETDLYRELEGRNAGDIVQVKVLRDGKEVTIPVKLVVINTQPRN